MATAPVYDEWEDTGLAVDDSEIQGYEVQALATLRIRDLTNLAQVIDRAIQVGISKPAFWKTVRARLLDAAGWYAYAMGVPAFEREMLEDLPDPLSSAGKALTLEAQKLSSLTALDWVMEHRADVEDRMRYAVTMGRRCVSKRAVSGWGKPQKSLSNKLANSIKKELDLSVKFEALLASMVD